jgi:hypothetical protein
MQRAAELFEAGARARLQDSGIIVYRARRSEIEHLRIRTQASRRNHKDKCRIY